MDPLLFAINGDLVVEVLTMIVLLSILIERALAIVFEWRPILRKIDEKGVKGPTAFITALVVVGTYKFDALAIIFSEENQSYFGYIITAAIIAGGSKGSMKLFREWMGFKSNALVELEEEKKKEKETAAANG